MIYHPKDMEVEIFAIPTEKSQINQLAEYLNYRSEELNNQARFKVEFHNMVRYLIAHMPSKGKNLWSAKAGMFSCILYALAGGGYKFGQIHNSLVEDLFTPVDEESEKRGFQHAEIDEDSQLHHLPPERY